MHRQIIVCHRFAPFEATSKLHSVINTSSCSLSVRVFQFPAVAAISS
jgi:hypothetical protein